MKIKRVGRGTLVAGGLLTGVSKSMVVVPNYACDRRCQLAMGRKSNRCSPRRAP